MQMWSMDTIVMGSSADKSRAKYIQVIIDHHSRYVWSFATPKNTSATVVTIFTQLLRIIGLPRILITDRGTNFTGKEFRRFLSTNNVEHRLLSPYHPQGNGMVEKVNHTIINGLRLAFVDNPKKLWSTHLESVVSTYNRIPHSATGFPPQFLQFGFTAFEQTSVDDARKLAVARSEATKDKRKAKHDSTHRPSNLSVGDLVVRRLAANHPSKKKTSPANTGPYKVSRILGSETYELVPAFDVNTGQLSTAHSSQLTLFRQRAETSPSGE